MIQMVIHRHGWLGWLRMKSLKEAGELYSGTCRWFSKFSAATPRDYPYHRGKWGLKGIKRYK